LFFLGSKLGIQQSASIVSSLHAHFGAGFGDESMKVKVLQIVWHNKEPVFSVDFHPSGVLATGGADSEIKVRS